MAVYWAGVVYWWDFYEQGYLIAVLVYINIGWVFKEKLCPIRAKAFSLAFRWLRFSLLNYTWFRGLRNTVLSFFYSFLFLSFLDLYFYLSTVLSTGKSTARGMASSAALIFLYLDHSQNLPRASHNQKWSVKARSPRPWSPADPTGRWSLQAILLPGIGWSCPGSCL